MDSEMTPEFRKAYERTYRAIVPSPVPPSYRTSGTDTTSEIADADERERRDDSETRRLVAQAFDAFRDYLCMTGMDTDLIERAAEHAKETILNG